MSWIFIICLLNFAYHSKSNLNTSSLSQHKNGLRPHTLILERSLSQSLSRHTYQPNCAHKGGVKEGHQIITITPLSMFFCVCFVLLLFVGFLREGLPVTSAPGLELCVDQTGLDLKENHWSVSQELGLRVYATTPNRNMSNSFLLISAPLTVNSTAVWQSMSPQSTDFLPRLKTVFP